MRLKINRVYHHHSKMEEYTSNMWKKINVKDVENFTLLSYSLMSDVDLFKRAMEKVVAQWVFSCESAFTATELNHRSWIGQAACAIEVNAPEDATRKAWGMLTDKQRAAANKVADEVVNNWKESYKDKIWPKLDLG